MKETLAVTSLAFALAAIYFFYSALMLPTSVEVEGGQVANLELMHIQRMNLAEAIGAAIISAILGVGAAIVSALQRD